MSKSKLGKKIDSLTIEAGVTNDTSQFEAIKEEADKIKSTAGWKKLEEKYRNKAEELLRNNKTGWGGEKKG